MPKEAKYRYLYSKYDEGFTFFLIMRYAAHFYVNIMNGQVRHDSPDTLIRYSRDWEYPWVLINSEIKKGYKVLDCGSGYSPLPFIWSRFGAEAYAIDKDVLICPRIIYILNILVRMAFDIMKFPFYIFKKIKNILVNNSTRIQNRNETIDGSCFSDAQAMNLFFRIRAYVNYLLEKNISQIKRMWKSDFWGPISPSLIKKYGVNYLKGTIINLPFPDDYFDIISCVSVLEHMPFDEQIQGIKEMSRVLKKNGKLLITFDKTEKELTNLFIKASGMILTEAVKFLKPDNLYNNNLPDVIAIHLIK